MDIITDTEEDDFLRFFEYAIKTEMLYFSQHGKYKQIKPIVEGDIYKRVDIYDSTENKGFVIFYSIRKINKTYIKQYDSLFAEKTHNWELMVEQDV